MFATFKETNDVVDAPKHKKNQFDRRILEGYIEELKFLYKYFGVQSMVIEIDSILKWNNKLKSTIALFIFIGSIYVFQPWMVSCALLLIFAKNYYIKILDNNFKGTLNLESSSIENNMETSRVLTNSSTNDKDILEADEKRDKKSILAIIRQIRNISHEIQRLLGKIVRLGQQIQNLIEFKVPFLSGIAMALLLLFTLSLWLMPFRYLIMMVGVKIILKGLISPNSKSFLNRLRIFISKVPDHEQLKQYISPKDVSIQHENSVSIQPMIDLESTKDTESKMPKSSKYDESQPKKIEKLASNPVRQVTQTIPGLKYTKGYVPVLERSDSATIDEEENCDDEEISSSCDRKCFNGMKIGTGLSRSVSNVSVDIRRSKLYSDASNDTDQPHDKQSLTPNSTHFCRFIWTRNTMRTKNIEFSNDIVQRENYEEKRDDLKRSTFFATDTPESPSSARKWSLQKFRIGERKMSLASSSTVSPPILYENN